MRGRLGNGTDCSFTPVVGWNLTVWTWSSGGGQLIYDNGVAGTTAAYTQPSGYTTETIAPAVAQAGGASSSTRIPAMLRRKLTAVDASTTQASRTLG